MAASPGDATQPKESSRWRRCLDLRFPITIEPLVLLYTLSVGLNEVIRSNLIIAKMCQVGQTSIPVTSFAQARLGYPSEVCANLTMHSEQQKVVQQHVSDYEAAYSSISFAPK